MAGAEPGRHLPRNGSPAELARRRSAARLPGRRPRRRLLDGGGGRRPHPHPGHVLRPGVDRHAGRRHRRPALGDAARRRLSRRPGRRPPRRPDGGGRDGVRPRRPGTAHRPRRRQRPGPLDPQPPRALPGEEHQLGHQRIAARARRPGAGLARQPAGRVRRLRPGVRRTPVGDRRRRGGLLLTAAGGPRRRAAHRLFQRRARRGHPRGRRRPALELPPGVEPHGQHRDAGPGLEPRGHRGGLPVFGLRHGGRPARAAGRRRRRSHRQREVLHPEYAGPPHDARAPRGRPLRVLGVDLQRRRHRDRGALLARPLDPEGLPHLRGQPASTCSANAGTWPWWNRRAPATGNTAASNCASGNARGRTPGAIRWSRTASSYLRDQDVLVAYDVRDR